MTSDRLIESTNDMVELVPEPYLFFQQASQRLHELRLCGTNSDPVPGLHDTDEYQDFYRSFQRLNKLFERKTSKGNPQNIVDTCDMDICPSSSSCRMTDFPDDLLQRILEFAESKDLSKLSLSCQRLKELAQQSALKRTQGNENGIMRGRTLPTALHMLRAQEQILGQALESTIRVPIPTLLLPHAVRLSNAGDDDYNGIYHCSESNGNGFVFTKPRNRQQPNLQCCIAKRFSNETLLWYLSKQIVETEVISAQDAEAVVRETTDSGQNSLLRYSFWARLSQLGDTSPDLCRYPSQTSVLTRHGDGVAWQPLSTTQHVNPPTVELVLP